jgi:Xaa-Pro aminopeptidase
LVDREFKEQKDTIENIKCIKNEREVRGMIECHIRDGAALMKYLAWLENELNVNGKTDISEWDGACKLEEFRSNGEFFMGLSFDTISSIGANGAIIHYSPEKETAMKINNKEVYLLDSGGQYLDGTTDTTRSVHFTKAKPFEKEAYTRVLRGVLDVERIQWPIKHKITGGDIDILARRPLWEAGLDYGHGTGHGVGYFLNVHEGPIGISKGYKMPMVPGMMVSDEPGYYKDGDFGIRIENIIRCMTDSSVEDFYCFENMTIAPYCRELIDTDFLSKKDVEYINNYHKRCLELLTPFLKNDEVALKYLQSQCEEIKY